MWNKLLSIFNNNSTRIPSGLGTADLPNSIYQGQQSIRGADFKPILNTVFAPKIHALGFKGKDFYYYRENSKYTEAVFFWTYKTGGALQIDLMVKFHEIAYPHEKPVKSQAIRPVTAEFCHRLSPNGERNRHGQLVWFWVFASSLEANTRIAEDIWRIFSVRGVEYFEHFKEHRQYLQHISPANYLEFPDFKIQHFFGRFEPGIIYFLFEYWRQAGDEEKARAFAKCGIERVPEANYPAYYQMMQKYLMSTSEYGIQ